MSGKSTNRMRGHWDDASEGLLSRCTERAEQTLDEYPLAVMAVALAAGLGIGTLVGASLARPMGFQPTTAETLGQRVLCAISELLPESINKQLRT